MTTALPALAAAAAVALAVGGPAATRRLVPTPVSAGRGRLLWAAAAGATCHLLGLPTVLVLAVPAAVVAAPAVRARRQRMIAQRSTEAAVVELCFGLAAQLRAGQPPGPALAAAAHDLPALGAALSVSAAVVARGGCVPDELAHLAATVPCPRLAPVAAVWASTERSGAQLAAVLERIGESFAADDRARDELRAALAGARASAMVLCALPVLGLLLGQSLGARPVALLLHTPLGAVLLVVAAVLDLLGIVWTRRLSARALR